MANEKPVLGQATCAGCEATVEVREDKAGKAYYFCDGRADERACGTRVTFGHRPTKQFNARMAKTKTEEKTDDQPRPSDTGEQNVTGRTDDEDKLHFE